MLHIILLSLQRTVRDMTCDVFVSNRNDFNIPGYATGSFNSTFVFYFLAVSTLTCLELETPKLDL